MKILFALLTLSLASCGLLKKIGYKEPAPEIKKDEGRRVIGRVASVSAEGKFVLIQKYRPGKLPENTLFQSHGISGSQGSLKPTGERVRDFFAADIISGNTVIGDAVTGLPMVSKEPKTSPVEAPKTTNPTPETPPSE